MKMRENNAKQWKEDKYWKQKKKKMISLVKDGGERLIIMYFTNL